MVIPQSMSVVPGEYRHFLDAIAHPNHQDHAEKLEWIGGEFNPAITDADGTHLGRAQPREKVEPQIITSQASLIQGPRRTDTARLGFGSENPVVADTPQSSSSALPRDACVVRGAKSLL